VGANCDNLLIHIFFFFFLHNGVKKHKLQDIHHKTLRKAGLSYKVVKAGPLCRTTSQSQNLYIYVLCDRLLVTYRQLAKSIYSEGDGGCDWFSVPMVGTSG